jgi:CRP/FNR family transcriptional regulator, cyclic AMP receptor protein
MDRARVTSMKLFAGLSRRERDEIARCTDEVDVQEGKRLVTEGDFAYEFFVIQEGTAQVVRGGEHVTDLGPGDFMGEMGIVQRTARNASVIATSPMKLAVMTAHQLESVSRSMPAVAERIRRAVEERSRSLVH